jgi:hypothetical protein
MSSKDDGGEGSGRFANHTRALLEKAWSSARGIESEMHLLEKSRQAADALKTKALQVAGQSGLLQHLAEGLGLEMPTDNWQQRLDRAWQSLTDRQSLNNGQSLTNSQSLNNQPSAHSGESGVAARLDMQAFILQELLASLFKTTPVETRRWTDKIAKHYHKSFAGQPCHPCDEAEAVVLLIGACGSTRLPTALSAKQRVRALLPCWSRHSEPGLSYQRLSVVLQSMASAYTVTRFFNPESRSPESLHSLERCIVEITTLLLVLVQQAQNQLHANAADKDRANAVGEVDMVDCCDEFEEGLQCLLTLIEQNRRELKYDSSPADSWIPLAELCVLADASVDTLLAEVRSGPSRQPLSRRIRKQLQERIASVFFQWLLEPGQAVDAEDEDVTGALLQTVAGETLYLQDGCLQGLDGLAPDAVVSLAREVFAIMSGDPVAGVPEATGLVTTGLAADARVYSIPSFEGRALPPCLFKRVVELFGLQWTGVFAWSMSARKWQLPLVVLLADFSAPISFASNPSDEELIVEECLYVAFENLLFHVG